MQAIDEYFVAMVKANPQLRARFGNPDESRSNHMVQTLALLKHRVTDIELADQEAIDGGVITALNEEAVICAALGNKGGINIAVTYEAFAVKMQSALRQEIIFAAHRKAHGHAAARWLSVICADAAVAKLNSAVADNAESSAACLDRLIIRIDP